MDDSTVLQTLEPSEAAAVLFPPNRRRPIRSHTYFNLIKLLSCCHADNSQLNGYSNGVGLRRWSTENVPGNHGELKSADLLVPNDILVQGTGISKSEANVDFQDGDLDDGRTTVSEQGCASSPTNVKTVVIPTDSICVGDFLVDGDINVDGAFQMVKEQENLNNVHIGPMEQLAIDKDFSIDDFSEVLDSCFGGDMVLESSKLGKNGRENNSALEVNTSNTFEHRVPLKAMELEKLVSISGADEEIEEGEIYSEAGISIVSIDSSKDAASLGDISRQTSEDNGEDIRSLRPDTCVDKVNDSMKVEVRAPLWTAQDIQCQSFCGDGHTETQGLYPIPTSTKTLPLTSLTLQNNAYNNPTSAITIEDGCCSTKKRKNGPSAEEKRAKKRKKRNLKRAETNRKLGVKRLKLQTVLKPKKIVYCHHYLRGRCHEGEKCKFSHDTTPLTKSKPCNHFARKSCMKGDDCPFDHQLSKYPCNNYASTGFCIRGADCLFSHEIVHSTPNVSKPELKFEQHTRPPKAGSFTASIVSKPEMKVFPQPKNLDPNNCAGILTSHQKVDTKISSPGNSSGKSVSKHVAKPFSRFVGHAPKGISFLTNTAPGQTSKLKLDESFQKSGDAVDVGHEANPKVPSSIGKLNEMSEGLNSRKPQGVNFLSFVQSSPDDTSFKKFSDIVSNRCSEAGKFVIADLANGKKAHPLSKNGDSFKDPGQTSRTATDWSQFSNGEANRRPVTLSSCINSVSLDKTQIDDSALRETANNKDATFFPPTCKKPTTTGIFPVEAPLFSSGGSCYQSTSAGQVSSSFKTSLLPNAPSLVQKAIQSTLAFAAKFEPGTKSGPLIL